MTNPKPATILRRLFSEIAREAETNPAFEQRLAEALGFKKSEETLDRSRKEVGALFIDPFVIYEQGEDELKRVLGEMDLATLRQIVAFHRLDSSQLARKWKTEERFIELILRVVKSRAHKGDVFRS